MKAIVAYREVFRHALNALAFALISSVEALRIELVPQPQSFHLAIQSRNVGFFWRRKVVPACAGRLGSQLRIKSQLVLGTKVVEQRTAFFSFFVIGFPTCVADGLGAERFGVEEEELCSTCSTSRSRSFEGTPVLSLPSSMYGFGSAPGSSEGNGLHWV